MGAVSAILPLADPGFGRTSLGFQRLRGNPQRVAAAEYVYASLLTARLSGCVCTAICLTQSPAITASTLLSLVLPRGPSTGCFFLLQVCAGRFYSLRCSKDSWHAGGRRLWQAIDALRGGFHAIFMRYRRAGTVLPSMGEGECRAS